MDGQKPKRDNLAYYRWLAHQLDLWDIAIRLMLDNEIPPAPPEKQN